MDGNGIEGDEDRWGECLRSKVISHTHLPPCFFLLRLIVGNRRLVHDQYVIFSLPNI